MSNYNLKNFEPFITRNVKEQLDQFVENKLGRDGEGIAILSYKKTVLESLFPGLNRYSIAVAISAYVDLVRDKWHIEYHRTTNNPYYFTVYKPGQPKDHPKRIHPRDFKEINSFLNYKLEEQKIAILSDKILNDNGYVLVTNYRQMWLLMNTFFGMHPEYFVIGVFTRYNRASLRYETIYMVTNNESHAYLSSKDKTGLFKYLLHGRFPAKINVDKVPKPAINLTGDIGYMMPIEADILKMMIDSPHTVRELVKKIPNSETLIRIAIKRLYVRGLINIVGRKVGGRGRSPYLFQALSKHMK